MVKKHILTTMAALALLLGHGIALAAEVPRMTTAELNKRLGDPNLVVLDVRSSGDWKSSDLMVAGAVRKSPGITAVWAGDLDRSKTIVLYCA